MKRDLSLVGFACVLVVIGLATGWYAARQGGEAHEGGGDAHEEHEGHDAEHEHDHVELSPQTLRNLGVMVGEARLGDFVRHANVQATVVDAPLNAVPVAAPLGGIVTELHVRPGDVVAAGAPLVSVARAPIPRPTLTLTADVLTPVSENLHDAVSRLRTAAAQEQIVRTELERVKSFTESGTDQGLPVLPRKALIDLQYDLARVEQEVRNAQRELERHGLAPDEIVRVQEGGQPPGSQRLWKRALEQNGLWGAAEEAILAALPEAARTQPWSIAAIGELAAAGLTGDDLAGALAEQPHMAEHFVAVASLLLEGNTPAKVRLLTEAGALEPVMTLKAPAGGAPDFDVAEIPVRPGQRVEAGETVTLLHDAREMWLRVEALGDEIGAVADALQEGTALAARPLIPGSGPELEGLRVSRLETRATEEQRGAVAWIPCTNEPVVAAEGGARSWRMRVGLRYLVLLPVGALEGCFVVPAGAVTEQGPDKVVFLPDGDTFRAVPVHVEYEDDQVAVLSDDGSFFEGDPIVLEGAFALGLALQGGGGGVDPHAGHDHG